MKQTTTVTILIAFLLAAATWAQSPAPATVSAPTQQKTLAATINVYVFPAKGQPPEVQNRQEAECYAWAVNNTKTDPFDLAKQAQQAAMTEEQQKQQVKEAGKGAGAKGALAGAAAGALIGEIADDDAGAGAAWGGAAGAIAARRRAQRKQAEATQQVEQQSRQVQQATAQQIEDFKKAFSICLEAKEYLVKF